MNGGNRTMKAYTILVALFLVCCLVGCNATTTQGVETSSPIATDNPNAQSTTPAEPMPFSITKSGNGYVYRIYNKNILVEENFSAKEPTVHYITDSLIYVTVQTGTGQSTNWGFFYDYSSNRRSNTFIWVLDFTESKVVVGYPDKVVVQSIFDRDYYFEFTDFDQPLARVADAIISAVFSDDESTVTVTYIVDGSYDLVTQTFSLIN